MYTFVYQNYKHKLYSYDSRRKNMGSTYGQFDMPTLRSALKTRFTIHGHGTTDIHRHLTTMNIDVMDGHFITIEDPKTAVWLKLNYDHITRKSYNHGQEMSFKGVYKDLEDTVIEQHAKDYREINGEINKIGTEEIRFHQFQSTAARFYQDSMSYKYQTTATQNHLENLVGDLKFKLAKIAKDKGDLQKDLQVVKDRAIAYLESKKL